MGRMHAGEPDIDTGLVRSLIAARFPHWANLPVTPVTSSGTDNAMFRLGTDLVVRLPRRPGAVADIDADQRWLPTIAPHLPVAVPEVVDVGEATEGYPWRWAVYRWLTGSNPVVDALGQPEDLAIDLAEFITALRRVDPADAPELSRSGPLTRRDSATREAIDASRGLIDTDALRGIWADTLTVDGSAPPAWAHGDLSPGNVLIDQDRLHAVIDFGGFGVGDPTVDLIIAWNLLPAAARPILRAALDVDEATWARGRGWALSISIIQLPYYVHTNPALADNSRHVLEQIVADQRAVGSTTRSR